MRAPKFVKETALVVVGVGATIALGARSGAPGRTRHRRARYPAADRIAAA